MLFKESVNPEYSKQVVYDFQSSFDTSCSTLVCELDRRLQLWHLHTLDLDESTRFPFFRVFLLINALCSCVTRTMSWGGSGIVSTFARDRSVV